VAGLEVVKPNLLPVSTTGTFKARGFGLEVKTSSVSPGKTSEFLSACAGEDPGSCCGCDQKTSDQTKQRQFACGSRQTFLIRIGLLVRIT
jgi:hypothetical protein